MSLNIIYYFQSSQTFDDVFRPARYKVIYCFSQNGFLDLPILQELAKCVPEADYLSLNFLSLDDLKIFALRVCEEFNSEDARLLSAQDYNIGLDSVISKENYREIFEKYGEVVIKESRSNKKSLLGKIFT
jgi:hypothetical protein